MVSLNQKNIWEFEKSFHLFPLGRAKLSGVFEKFFVLQKTPSLIWTKGAEMHTHFRAFSRKFFWEKILPFTYLELQSQMTPYFTEKMRKYFLSGCWMAYFYLSKKVPSLIPTENSQMHPLNLKKFLSLHLFGIGMPKRNLFFRKNIKISIKKLFISKTSLHLFPLGEGIWGR